MIQLDSNQLQSTSDQSNSKQREQKVMMILSFLTEKSLVFPRILQYLAFSESKGVITIKKGESLLKSLTKTYNFDVIQEFFNEQYELKEQELIMRMLQLYLERIETMPVDDLSKSISFCSFYYKLFDYCQRCTKESIKVCFDILQQICNKIPNLTLIQPDFKAFIYFKSQLIFIAKALSLQIPVIGLLDCTSAFLNNQEFIIEFDISKKVFECLYSQRILSDFNFHMKIEQLIAQEPLSIYEMSNYIDKVFPSYEYLLKDNNFNIFNKNLELIMERKHQYISELKVCIQQPNFKILMKGLSASSLQSSQADLLHEMLNKLVKFISQSELPIFDFTPVNVPTFIRNNFYKNHEKQELTSQQQVEAMLIITKILTEMIKNKFPFPLLISYLSLDCPDDSNLIKVTKEFIIECQNDKSFNLFLALTHYNFQNIAKSQVYSKAFYKQQLAQQEFEQSEIVIKMLKLILSYKSVIANQIDRVLSDEDTKWNLLSYITYPKAQISEYNSHYREIAGQLKLLLQFSKEKVKGNNDIELADSLRDKIAQISYQVTLQPYSERRLGRPPGFYSSKIYKEKKQSNKNYLDQMNQIQDDSHSDVIMVEKKLKLNTEQKLLYELSSFLD